MFNVWLCVVCYVLCDDRCLRLVDRCLLFVVCWLLFGVFGVLVFGVSVFYG